jgi:hypothetical protein
MQDAKSAVTRLELASLGFAFDPALQGHGRDTPSKRFGFMRFEASGTHSS